jgi:hypothetical protein
MPFFQWNDASGWGQQQYCLPHPSDPDANVGPPYPDWLSRDGAAFMGQITGNPNFGLMKGQVLNLISGKSPGTNGQLGIFWVWFVDNKEGMLFSKGNFMNSLSHTLQLLDYTLFLRNAPIVESDFSDPCTCIKVRPRRPVASVSGHFTHPRRVQSIKSARR